MPASSYSVPNDGCTTRVAVIAHEIPQEVGDFGILLQSGYSRRKAFLYNILSSLTASLGAIVACLILPMMQLSIPYFLTISAASFIYIALADLVPGRRNTGGVKSLVWEVPLILLGISTVAFL